MIIELDNGVVLPEIDDELIAVRPYITVIYYPDEEHKYRAWASREVTLFGSEELVGVDAVTTVDEQAIVLWGTAGEAEWAGSSGAYQMPEGAAMAPMDTCELVWANHDIHKITSIDIENMEFVVGEEIYFANSEARPDRASIGHSLMDKIANEVQRLTGLTNQMNAEEIRAWLQVLEVAEGIRIGDVTLPAIPEDVLAQYPYAIISQAQRDGGTTFYYLYAASSFLAYAEGSVFGVTDYDEMVTSQGAGVRYRYDPGESQWSQDKNYTAGQLANAVGEFVYNSINWTEEVVWSNHDIIVITSVDYSTGEFTTDGIYFPPLEAIDSDRVSIGYGLFNDMVKNVQRLSGTSEKMNALKAYWWLTTLVAVS